MESRRRPLGRRRRSKLRGARGPQPPNIEEIAAQAARIACAASCRAAAGRGRGIAWSLAALVVLWVASGFYRVEPDEQGIVLRFGAYDRTTNPGLNYHLPTPIEEALTPKVTRVNRVEVGFRETRAAQAARTELPEESLMLTGDENIIDINFIVLWVIKDAKDYLFNIRNPDGTVKSAAESAMREVIGHTEIASALDRAAAPKIEADTQKLLQEILDSYKAGIEITNVQLQKVDPPDQVIDAFRDVQSAKIDQQRLINEAEAYRNNVVPVAHGDAARIVQEAEAYRAQVVLQAQGDAARFLSVYKSYKAAAGRDRAPALHRDDAGHPAAHQQDHPRQGRRRARACVPYLPLPQLRADGAAGAASARAAAARRHPRRAGSTPMSTRSSPRSRAAAVVVLILALQQRLHRRADRAGAGAAVRQADPRRRATPASTSSCRGRTWSITTAASSISSRRPKR